jgi:dihydroxyacetone kinase-like protein
MVSTIGFREWTAMMAGAIAQVKSAHPFLSELDSACGDGDHGTTMLRAATRLEKCLAQNQSENMQSLLTDIAWALMGLDGGATGPLLGSFFLGVSEAVGLRNALDAQSLAEVFEAGLAALQKQSKAQVGDKTVFDAFVPAVKAMRQAADRGLPALEMLRAGAIAAQEGAARTKDFVARIGRARYLGEKTLGIQDPGATSVSLLFKGFNEGLQKMVQIDQEGQPSK